MLHLLLLIALLLTTTQDLRGQSPFTVVSYNCENLFDCKHDSLKNDEEFLPGGNRAWSNNRLWKKVNDIGRAIHQCGEGTTLPPDTTSNTTFTRLPSESAAYLHWHQPDIVALIEVENDSVMRLLTRRSMLKNSRYSYIITNSDDNRGVDVALMYNPQTFKVVHHHSIKPILAPKQRPTRDILYVKGYTRSDDTLHIFVIHAPSRSGGQVHTNDYRVSIARQLTTALDSIHSDIASSGADIAHNHFLIMGDFNDYSHNTSLRILTDYGLTEISKDAKGIKHPHQVLGTYKYGGKWESLDHIFVSMPLKRKTSHCHILDNNWLLQKDALGGLRPFRTYLGEKYHGGVSDHLPIVATFLF